MQNEEKISLLAAKKYTYIMYGVCSDNDTLLNFYSYLQMQKQNTIAEQFDFFIWLGCT